MARIQISKETLEKLKSASADDYAVALLLKFDPERPCPSRETDDVEESEIPEKNVSREGMRSARKGLAQELHAIRQAHGIKLPSRRKRKRVKAKTLKPSRVRSIERRLEKKQIRMKMEADNLKKVRETSNRAKPSANPVLFHPSELARKSTTRKRNEDGILEVENLKKELEELRAVKESDPNVFDRSAMK